MEKPFRIDDRTKLFAIDIIHFCEKLKSHRVEYPLRDQLLRSGTSIGANVHEGKSSSSRNEFKRYYEIALRSANETEYWLDLIDKAIQTEESKSIRTELSQIKNIIASIILKLKNNKS